MNRELDPCSIRFIFRRKRESDNETWYHTTNTDEGTYGKTKHIDLPPHSGKHENDKVEVQDVRLIGVAETKLRGHINDQNNWKNVEEMVEELETNNDVHHYWIFEDRLNRKETEELENNRKKYSQEDK